MSLPKAQVDQLKAFVAFLKAKPEMLHEPALAFLKEYLESLGATIPPKPEPSPAPGEPEEAKKEPEEPMKEPEEPMEEPEPESEESDVELDMSGVVQPDKEEAKSMGDPTKELQEEDFDKFDEKRSEAMGTFSEGEWEKAIGLFTEAIEINATSAMPFVKRAQCFLKLSKPNACIVDC